MPCVNSGKFSRVKKKEIRAALWSQGSRFISTHKGHYVRGMTLLVPFERLLTSRLLFLAFISRVFVFLYSHTFVSLYRSITHGHILHTVLVMACRSSVGRYVMKVRRSKRSEAIVIKLVM